MGDDRGQSQGVIDWARHSEYSDPGRFVDLVADLPTDPAALSAVARNVIVHYRASGHELPVATQQDINSRWLDAILAADQSRHPRPLTEPRDVLDRVQGCCRDHTLFCVGVLRSHGIPARSLVGFAGYFADGWHHDHVIVEVHIDGRWQRFDAEIEAPLAGLPTPMDMGHCPTTSRGFVTAAQVWVDYRYGELDLETYGVGPEVPGLRGPRFAFDQVIIEVAHRFGDELLLWDGWGRIGAPEETVSEEDAAWLDPIADLLLAAESGDAHAERALLQRYRADAGLHPGPTIIQASPYGHPPIEVELRAAR